MTETLTTSRTKLGSRPKGTRAAALACCVLVSFGVGGCSDRYGRVDPLRTGLLGAGLGAGVFGLGGLIAQGQRHRRPYGHGGGYGYSAPARLPPVARPYGGYGWGYGR